MSSVNMPSSPGAAPFATNAAMPDFRASAQKFVNSSKKVADVILESAPSITGGSSIKTKHKVHHHHYHGYGFSPFFWPSRTTYIVAPNGYTVSDRDSGDRALRWVVGMVSAAVGAAAFYAIGSFVNSYKKIEKRLSETENFKNDLANRLSTEPPELVNKLENIATLRGKILNRMREKNIFKLAAVVAFAAASTIAVVGAVIGSPGLMAAGTLLGLGAGAVVLVKWGMDNTESKQKRDAKALMTAVNGLPAF